MKYSVLIRISRFGESPERAIGSVLTISKQVEEVVVVSPYVTEKTQLYDHWKRDKASLKKEGITLRFERKFNLNAIKTPLLMEMPSTMQIKDKADVFQGQLEDTMKKVKRYQRFAFDAVHDFSVGSFSLWYLYIALIFCLDWWRQTYSWFTFHTGYYIRVTEIWRGHERCLKPPKRSPWVSVCGFGSKSERHPIERTSGICIMGPTGARLSGRKYYLYYMDQRDGAFGQGYKGWYIIYAYFYAFIGLCWWGRYLIPVIHWALEKQARIPVNVVDALFEPFTTGRILIWIVAFVAHYMILALHFKWHRGYKRNVLITALIAASFPILVLILPMVILWSKADKSHDTYQYELDPAKEKMLNDIIANENEDD